MGDPHRKEKGDFTLIQLVRVKLPDVHFPWGLRNGYHRTAYRGHVAWVRTA